jgi:hypothetical protein
VVVDFSGGCLVCSLFLSKSHFKNYCEGSLDKGIRGYILELSGELILLLKVK